MALVAMFMACMAVDMVLVAVFIACMAVDMFFADEVALVAAAAIWVADEATFTAAEDTVLAAPPVVRMLLAPVAAPRIGLAAVTFVLVLDFRLLAAFLAACYEWLRYARSPPICGERPFVPWFAPALISPRD